MTEEERENLINDMEIAILKEGVGTILHSSQLSRMARAALVIAEGSISKDSRARISELEAALNGWQQWWELPWRDRRPDIAERCYCAASAALKGEK